MALDDEQGLLARIAAGDDDALRQLYAAYRPRLWRYLWQLTWGDAMLAEEALQDAFVAVWRHAGSYRGDAPVAAWIFRIAHNQAANMLRSRSRRPATLGDPALLEGESAEPLVWPETAAIERLTLEDALRHLSPKHREALELVFAAGFSCDEAARVLDVPVGTVKSRLHAARKALAAWLRAETETREEVSRDV
ncbi:MAG TPA: RNA polymerase sigma factor [Ktedonobacterales bacterium]